MQIGTETDGEAAVTSTLKQRVNNLTIQKAFVLTAKAFEAGGAKAMQSAPHQPKGQVTHLKLLS